MINTIFDHAQLIKYFLSTPWRPNTNTSLDLVAQKSPTILWQLDYLKAINCFFLILKSVGDKVIVTGQLLKL